MCKQVGKWVNKGQMSRKYCRIKISGITAGMDSMLRPQLDASGEGLDHVQ